MRAVCSFGLWKEILGKRTEKVVLYYTVQVGSCLSLDVLETAH